MTEPAISDPATPAATPAQAGEQHTEAEHLPRTPEQVAADDALTSAIEQVLTAYEGTDQAWVLSEYVVVSAQHRFDDDGDSITAVGCINRDSDVPLHRMLGLLEYAAVRTRRTICDDDD